MVMSRSWKRLRPSTSRVLGTGCHDVEGGGRGCVGCRIILVGCVGLCVGVAHETENARGWIIVQLNTISILQNADRSACPKILVFAGLIRSLWSHYVSYFP